MGPRQWELQSAGDLTTADGSDLSASTGFRVCCENGILRFLPAASPTKAPCDGLQHVHPPRAAVGAGAHLYFRPLLDDHMLPMRNCSSSANDREINF